MHKPRRRIATKELFRSVFRMRLHRVELSILVFVKCVLVNNAIQLIPESAASPTKRFTTSFTASGVIGGPTINSDLRVPSKRTIHNLGGQWITPPAEFTKELNSIQNFLEFKKKENPEPVRRVVPGLAVNGQSKNIQILQPVSRPTFRIPKENNFNLPDANPIAPPKPIINLPPSFLSNLPASIFENSENQFSNGFRSDTRNTKNSGSNRLFRPSSFDGKSFSFQSAKANEVPASAMDAITKNAWEMVMRNYVLPKRNPMPQRNSDMGFFHRTSMRNSPIASSNDLPPNVLLRQMLDPSSIDNSPNRVLSTPTSLKILLELFKMTLAEASKSPEAMQPQAHLSRGIIFNNDMPPEYRDMNLFQRNNLEPSGFFRGRSGFNTGPVSLFKDVHSQMRNHIAQLTNANGEQRPSNHAWHMNQIRPEPTRTAVPLATPDKKATLIEQIQNYVNVSVELSQTLQLVLQQATKLLARSARPKGPSDVFTPGLGKLSRKLISKFTKSFGATPPITTTWLPTTTEEEEPAEPTPIDLGEMETENEGSSL